MKAKRKETKPKKIYDVDSCSNVEITDAPVEEVFHSVLKEFLAGEVEICFGDKTLRIKRVER